MPFGKQIVILSLVISGGFLFVQSTDAQSVISLGSSFLTVRPLTRLSLEEIIQNQDGEQVNLYLQTGRVRATVNPPSGGTVDFTVRSPSVTASVRGTSFDFDTENIRVEEGRVQYFLANGRRVYVNEGERSYVDEANNRVASPFEAAREDVAPGLPPGSGSGYPAGDNAPVVTPPQDRQVGSAGVGFGWD
jgi:hypothetical protein